MFVSLLFGTKASYSSCVRQWGDIVDLKRIVSKNVRKYRVKRGMTQAELAAKCGIDVRYVNRLENQPQNVGLDHLQRLAEGLLVSPTMLVSAREISEIENGKTVVTPPGTNELDEVMARLEEIRSRLLLSK
jgi:transcriptional regulator with XRE-family HTH domain